MPTVLSRDSERVVQAVVVPNEAANTWYVNSVTGNDSYGGKSASSPKATIAAAVALASAGDTIFIRGSFNEAVTCSTVGLRFIGVGTGPQQSQWTAPTVAGSWCLKIAAEQCLVENIKIRPVVYTTSGVPAGIYLTGAAYTIIRNCRFQGRAGSYKAIYAPAADTDNVTIERCEFIYMNTATHGAAIWGVNAGGVSFSGWQIINNAFHSCVTAIKLSCRCATIKGNTIAEYGVNAAGAVAQLLALGIDLAGSDATGSGANAVWANQLGGTYNATLYKKGTSGDQWGGNFNVLSGGVTADNPA